MPPRYSYWTILAGGLPTAFRAAERADLLPTFNRIREKHPDAQMKWFARGRLWESPEEAQADLQRARVRRDRDWRPGGEHRDPRQTFKKPRDRDDERRTHKSRRPAATGEQPAGHRPTGQRPSGQRPTGHRPTGHRPTGKRPHGHRPAGPPRKRQR